MSDSTAKILEFPLRTCTKCGLSKPFSDFKKEKRVKCGRQAKCRSCMNILMREYRKRTNYDSKWILKNPDKVNEYRKKYYKKQSEKRKLNRQIFGLPILEERMTIDGRMCSGCRKRSSIENFSCDKSYPDGYPPYCRKCAAKRSKKWKEENWEKVMSKNRPKYRKYHISSKYGLSFEEYTDMLSAQNGRCAICLDQFNGNEVQACIDHCHSTDKVRGILCKKCNSALGMLRDDERICMAAMNYLSKSREK